MAYSPQAISAGLVPGAIFILVDKHDGHVWTDDDARAAALSPGGDAAGVARDHRGGHSDELSSGQFFSVLHLGPKKVFH